MSFRLISRNEEKSIETSYIVDYKIHIETPETSLAKMYETKNEMIVTLEVPKSDYSNINIQRLLEWCKTPVYEKDYYRDLAVHLEIEEINERSIVFTHAKMTYETITDVKSDYVTIILTINQKLDRLSGVAFGIELEETYERAIKKANNPPLLNIYKVEEKISNSQNNAAIQKELVNQNLSKDKPKADVNIWLDAVCYEGILEEPEGNRTPFAKDVDVKIFLDGIGEGKYVSKTENNKLKVFKQGDNTSIKFLEIKKFSGEAYVNIKSLAKEFEIEKNFFPEQKYNNKVNIILYSNDKLKSVGDRTAKDKIKRLIAKIKNNTDDAIKVSFDESKNTIYLKLNFNFIKKDLWLQEFNDNEIKKYLKIDSITSINTSDYEYWKVFIKGIKDNWNSDATIIFGELVTVAVDIDYIFDDEKLAVNRINVDYYGYGDRCEDEDNKGNTHVHWNSSDNYSKSNPGSIKMFIYDNRTPINGKYFMASVSFYMKAAAHELAHILGDYDGYNDNNDRPSINEEMIDYTAQGIDYEKFIAACITKKYQAMERGKNDKIKFSEVDKSFDDLI